MGKRQQLRSKISLLVQGPKRFMNRSVFGVANLKQTWYQFLTSHGVKLTPHDRLHVRTDYLKSKYRQGWTANLNNEIGDMLKDVRQVKEIYSARLRFDLEGNTPKDKTVIKEGHQWVSGPNLNKRLQICRPKIIQQAPSSCKTRRTRVGKAKVKISEGDLYLRPRYRPNFTTGRVTSNPLSRYGTRQKTINTQTIHDEIPSSSAGHNMKSILRNKNASGRGGRGKEVRFAEQPVVMHSPVTFQTESQNEEYLQQETDETTLDTLNRSQINVSDIGQVLMGHVKLESCDVEAEAQIPEEDDDNLSFITDVTTQENELRRQGIPIEDVQSQVDERIKKMFNNPYLIKIKHEINNLKGTGGWVSIVRKLPISAYFLQELFKQG